MASEGGPDKAEIDRFRSALLGWYDRERRVLPWRAASGRADPYRVWLSEIMLQQTTVAAVIPYFEKFTRAWPDIVSLAGAEESEILHAWAGLGYYSRARNLHKCARTVAAAGGAFPEDVKALKALPGIGDYTAAAIAAIACDRPATVVDGNVERVLARHFLVERPLPESKKEIKALATGLSEGRTDRPGDFAQAMMDLGATVCVPRPPRCGLCPLSVTCGARREGLQNALPARKPKKARPKRTGYVYVVSDGNGRILLQRRPASGLLGGMAGLPTTDWVDEGSASTLTHLHDILSLGCDIRVLPSRVSHVFTHFELTLIPALLRWPGGKPWDGFYWSSGQGREWGLPSVFRKVVNLIDRKETGSYSG